MGNRGKKLVRWQDRAPEVVTAVRWAERNGYLWGAADSPIAYAAGAVGISKNRVTEILQQAGFERRPEVAQEKPEVSEIPELHEILPRLQRNARHIERAHKKHFLNFKVRGPFAIVAFGDPHMDSPGFDFDQFKLDCDMTAEIGEVMPVFPVNMGDLLDHWPTGGKLGKKHHDAHLTRQEALGLAKAFVSGQMGVDFACHLLGNHDDWPGVDFASLLREWADAPVIEWGARLTFQTPRGEFVADLHHDFPGHSMHNPLHALMRRAAQDGSANLHVAAHRHRGGQGKFEDGYRGKTYHHMRVRGYKRADEYAFVKGYAEEREGCAGVAIVNPLSSSQDGLCRTFYDFQDAADWARVIAKRAA